MGSPRGALSRYEEIKEVNKCRVTAGMVRVALTIQVGTCGRTGSSETCSRGRGEDVERGSVYDGDVLRWTDILLCGREGSHQHHVRMEGMRYGQGKDREMERRKRGGLGSNGQPLRDGKFFQRTFTMRGGGGSRGCREECEEAGGSGKPQGRRSWNGAGRGLGVKVEFGARVGIGLIL